MLAVYVILTIEYMSKNNGKNIHFTGERMLPDANRDNLIFGEHILRYLIPAALTQDKIVLDVACGSGYGVNILAKKAKKVCGLDNSPEAIDYARDNYLSDNVELSVGDATSFPYDDDFFDVVTSFETIEHLADYRSFLGEVKRVLKNNGLLFISTPVRNEDNLKNKFHVHEFAEEEFKIVLKKYYRNVHVYGQNNFVLNSIYDDLSDITKQDCKSIINSGLNTKYMYAVCSDGEIPDIDLINIISSPDELADIGSINDRDRVINDQHKTISQLRFANKVLNRQLHTRESSKKKIELMESSTSWKITKPIRWMGDFLKSFPEDIKSGLKLLQKEGWRQFFYRLYWYLLGKKTIDSIPPPYRDYNLINYLDKPQERLIFNKCENPEVSIVIPVYNQWKYTYACLLSILENSQGIEYEVIIGDDNSKDKTVDIENIVSNITVVRNEEEDNLGFVKNCNHAARAARGKYILLLNNDTNVQPGWLDSLLELVKRDEKNGIVGSKLIFADGSMQEAGSIIWNDGAGWNYGRGDDPTLSDYNYVKEVDYASGACILIRADLWRQLGGFDEQFSPGYYEETDFAFSTRKAGYKVMFQPESRVLHFGSVTFSNDKKELLEDHRQKFFAKWQDVLEKEQFTPAEHVFWARDRSRNKKTLLYIDHHVPMCDQDAGSRATWQYLQMFVDLDLNVKFMPNDFYAHEPYTKKLQQMGIEVLHGSWYQQNWQSWILENEQYFDLVVISRPHIAAKYLDFILENTSAKVYYMAHDLHFLREEREAKLTNNINVRKTDKLRDTELDIMAIVDKTFLFSDFEKEKIRQIDHSLEITNIPLFIYREPFKEKIDFLNRKDLLFVGGFNHPPNVDAAKYLCQDIWPQIKGKIPGIKLYLVGSKPPKEILNLASEDIVVTGHVSDEELINYYQKCRLAVMPLRYGAGVKGKIIESIYYNLPIITSNVGAEGLPASEDVLIIADDAGDFAHKVVEYYQDENKYNEIVSNFEGYIENNFSYNRACDLIKRAFKL